MEQIYRGNVLSVPMYENYWYLAVTQDTNQSLCVTSYSETRHIELQKEFPKRLDILLLISAYRKFSNKSATPCKGTPVFFPKPTEFLDAFGHISLVKNGPIFIL